MKSRTANSIRNSGTAILTQIMSIILSFITRTVFIKTLGADYLGVNGLFSSILSMLSLAEMGFGTAIIYEMYKPLAVKDEKTISALVNLYSKVYQFIGAFIGVIGILLIPFLKYLIKDSPNIQHLEIIYLLFLMNSVVSYFFTYKRSIIIANQQAYIDNLNTITFSIIQNIFQIFVLIFTKQYMLYLSVQFFSVLLSNIFISKKADKLFPYLAANKCAKVDKIIRQHIVKNVVAMMSNKIGSVVVSGTDNLLISAFVGVYSVGLYSNYVLIVNTAKSLIMQPLNAITASVGNLVTTDNNKKAYDIFVKIYFINYAITYFCTIFIFFLINPFIKIWIGESYLLDWKIVLMITISFYVIQMRQTAIIFINTYGLFWRIKWKSIVEAIVNILASLIFLVIFKMGILGILLGTLISNAFTNVWWEPYVVYKFGFKERIKNYLKVYLVDGLKCSISLIIINYIFYNMLMDGWAEIFSKAGISFVVGLFLFTIMNYKNKNFTFIVNFIRKYLKI